MFCPYCGTNLKDGHLFCYNCGKQIDVDKPIAQTKTVEVKQGNTLSPQEIREWNEREYAKNLPKEWFKFLINFALFADALLLMIEAIRIMSGGAYGKDRVYVYAAFPNLKTVNILVGILEILLAAFCIIIRFRLAGFYKDGPPMLVSMCIASAALIMVHILFIHFITNIDIIGILSNNILSVISFVESIILAIVNYSYFKKRKPLFNK